MSYEVAQMALSANVRARSPLGQIITVGQVMDAIEEEEVKEEMYEKSALDLIGQ